MCHGWGQGGPLFSDGGLLLVESDIAAVVLADALEGRRVRVRVAPCRVVMGGAVHGDVVILGVALPRAVVRSRAVSENAGADRRGREVVVALDGDKVCLLGIRYDRAIDDGLHFRFPSGSRTCRQRQLRAGCMTSRAGGCCHCVSSCCRSASIASSRLAAASACVLSRSSSALTCCADRPTLSCASRICRPTARSVNMLLKKMSANLKPALTSSLGAVGSEPPSSARSERSAASRWSAARAACAAWSIRSCLIALAIMPWSR